jgi:hypothetical protein
MPYEIVLVSLPPAFVAVTENVPDPLDAGTPDTNPVDGLIAIPDGSPDADHVIGAVPDAEFAKLEIAPACQLTLETGVVTCAVVGGMAVVVAVIATLCALACPPNDCVATIV